MKENVKKQHGKEKIEIKQVIEYKIYQARKRGKKDKKNKTTKIVTGKKMNKYYNST